jgi:hypothetical protein
MIRTDPGPPQQRWNTTITVSYNEYRQEYLVRLDWKEGDSEVLRFLEDGPSAGSGAWAAVRGRARRRYQDPLGEWRDLLP